MARDVVEVTARFGTTILDIAYVGAAETYRIGSAPDVNVAVHGHTTFPLVNRGVIRWPVGVPARQDADTTELHIGGVSFSLTRCALPSTPVDRAAFNWRPFAFGLASLLVHVGVWLVAITVAPFEQLVVAQHQPRLRHAHVAKTSEPEPEPKPEPKPEAAKPRAVSPEPRQHPRVSRAELGSTTRKRIAKYSQAARDVAAMAAQMKVAERIGALRAEDNYTEDDTYNEGFGGRTRMGPGETIKTPEGYQLMLYDVKLCPSHSCTVNGPIPASYIRPQLHARMKAIYACYVEHADGPGTIVLEFTIEFDGGVVNARGHGLGETGACAARALHGVYFKAIGDNDVLDGGQKETIVSYPVRFN